MGTSRSGGSELPRDLLCWVSSWALTQPRQRLPPAGHCGGVAINCGPRVTICGFGSNALPAPRAPLSGTWRDRYLPLSSLLPDVCLAAARAPGAELLG